MKKLIGLTIIVAVFAAVFIFIGEVDGYFIASIAFGSSAAFVGLITLALKLILS